MEYTGVLLMNIGTPDEPTVESVRKYLREFLLDPDVIDIDSIGKAKDVIILIHSDQNMI